jgi:hypothetical protein
MIGSESTTQPGLEESVFDVLWMDQSILIPKIKHAFFLKSPNFVMMYGIHYVSSRVWYQKPEFDMILNFTFQTCHPCDKVSRQTVTDLVEEVAEYLSLDLQHNIEISLDVLCVLTSG